MSDRAERIKTERPHKIAIVGGTGALGTGVALRLAAAGHAVTVGSRDANKARAIAAELSARAGQPIAGADNRAAAGASEIVFLTVPYAVQQSSVSDVLDQLRDKIVVDTTVPLIAPKPGLAQLSESAVAVIQDLVGESVRVVSALQNVSARHLNELGHEVDCDVLVCGDDRAACDTVIALCADMGLRGLLAGPLRNSLAAEALTSVLISINRHYKVRGAGIRITGIGDGER